MVCSSGTAAPNVSNIKGQDIPFVTGPGAVKTGLIRTIGGHGYFRATLYTGLNNRNVVTIVGSSRMALKGSYVHRDSVEKRKAYPKMNMTRYGIFRGGKAHSCFMEVYNSAEVVGLLFRAVRNKMFLVENVEHVEQCWRIL